MPTGELKLECDTYILKTLEYETKNINQYNNQAGLKRIDASELAREVLADWAINLLLQHQEQSRGKKPQTSLSRSVNDPAYVDS